MPQHSEQSLCDADWSLAPIGHLRVVPKAAQGSIPAHIPGCVHTDLIAAGNIGDPAIGLNELEQQWIGQTDWEYRGTFEAQESLFQHERIDLVCDGLDTIASVELNGVPIGTATNMFHPHRFDIRSALHRGNNELVIRFKSPIRHIREEEARLGARPVNGDWDPYIFIRKAACNFGWDWAPKVATCGVWKPIRLEGWSGVRIAGVRPLVRNTGNQTWRIESHVGLEWASAKRRTKPVRLWAGLGGNTDPRHPLDKFDSQELHGGEPSISLVVHTQEPQLWWPRGFGQQTRHTLGVYTTSGDAPSGLSQAWEGVIGFREITLDTTPDAHSSSFALRVNDKPIFCKGANWIPEGLFPAQMTREKYRERLEQAAAANMNMLRVWGGGYYESDDFYELCDELGILVWQDFMFACAMYPEEPPYPTLIEAEARHQITRLSPHPSVALWCGGNECVWAHGSWGNAPGERPWKERLGDKTWGSGYYFDLLPRLMQELDPTRPYWPNSPWSGAKDVPLNDTNHGDRHTWEVRGDGYRTIVPRFCSEFGHQAPANHTTLAKAIGPAGLTLGSRDLEHRQRGNGGTARHIDEAIAECFRPPRDFDEWHYLAQLTQARALRTGIEWMRANQPACMGALVWQLNDAWPGMSWSLIDSDGVHKLAWESVRCAFAPVALSIQQANGRPILVAVNDRDEPARFEVDIQRFRLDGMQHAITRAHRFDVPPRSAMAAADVEALVGPPDDPADELIIATSRSCSATWAYLPDRDLKYRPPRFQAHLTRVDDGAVALTVVAENIIRDAAIFVDRAGIGRPLRSSVSPSTLIPDSTWGLMIRDADARPDGRATTAETLTTRPIFWCANHFGATP